MSSQFISTFQWRAMRIYERLSKIALLMIVLLLLYLLWFVLAYLPLKQTVARMQMQAKTEQPTPVITPTDSLQVFQSQLPNIASRASKVDQLMQLMAQEGLQVDEVRYQTDADVASYSRYHVKFNTQTTYPKVHRLLNTVLIEMPFVALDKFTLRREDVLDETIDVEMSFYFYFKKHETDAAK